MNIKITCYFLVALTVAFSQDVVLSFGDYDLDLQSLDINFTSTENIEAFEMLITGITITGGSLGLGSEYGFFLSTSDSGYVLSFGFPGDFIPPSQGLLCTLDFSEDFDAIPCFQMTHFSGNAGIDLTVQNDGCILIDFPPEIILGDVNQDLEIDILDVVLIVDYILGNIVFNELEEILGDLNGDNNIDVVDVVIVINIILN